MFNVGQSYDLCHMVIPNLFRFYLKRMWCYLQCFFCIKIGLLGATSAFRRILVQSESVLQRLPRPKNQNSKRVRIFFILLYINAIHRIYLYLLNYPCIPKRNSWISLCGDYKLNLFYLCFVEDSAYIFITDLTI